MWWQIDAWLQCHGYWSSSAYIPWVYTLGTMDGSFLEIKLVVVQVQFSNHYTTLLFNLCQHSSAFTRQNVISALYNYHWERILINWLKAVLSALSFRLGKMSEVKYLQEDDISQINHWDFLSTTVSFCYILYSFLRKYMKTDWQNKVSLG